MNFEEFAGVIDNLCSQYDSGGFVPLLEADITGYIHHALLAQKLVSLAHIHLDSRAIGAKRNQKFDILLGPVAIREDGRPAISAVAVVEIKSFPRGFTDQQHRVHFEHVLNDDIPKLSRFSCPLKVELLFDEVGYLTGSYHREHRIEVIVRHRARHDANINILLIQRKGDRLVTQRL